MSDDFLDLFEADFSVTKDETETVFIVELDIKKVIAEVHLPNKMLKKTPKHSVGQLIIERVMIDLTEGVTEALNKVDSDMFPSFAQYKLP